MTKDLADELERLAKEATPGEWLHAGGLIYSLRQSGWRRGQPVMVNDITIRIESTSSDPEPITQAILSALRGEQWQGIETALGDIATEQCGDCPPLGYPTDETRCLPCPRRHPAERN